MTIRNKVTGEWNTFPCGKCPECLARRTSGWSFRLMEESKRAESAHFVTLTYATAPVTKKGFMTLCKKDVQDFFKRLRYYLGKDVKIKYYVVGEYGTRTLRPHYHAIIFGANYYGIEKAWSLDNKRIGLVHYGVVNGASVGYTLKYMSKPSKIPLHKNDDRVKEFSLMSKGLAATISHLGC
ncbi:replication initiation protein [Tortoise microvirus 89]|nr:replication initiation protein [Tortoise microvirus 89]